MITLGVQCSVLANTSAKLLAGIPLLQLMQMRFLLQWVCSFSCALCLRLRGEEIYLTGFPGCRLRLAGRAVFVAGALGCLWMAVRLLPVGEATAIVYLHPVACGLLAWQFLGEDLNKPFWMQAGASFVGVSIVADAWALLGAGPPPGGHLYLGVSLAVSSCFCFACDNALVRGLPAVHPLEVQVFSDSILGLIFMPIVLLASGAGEDWSSWGGREVGLLAAFTAFGLSTSFLAIMGFRLAPASKAALFMYLEVPSAFAMQIFVFEAPLRVNALVGALLITAASLLRLVYELRTSGEVPVDLVTTPSASPLMSPLRIGLTGGLDPLLPPMTPLSLDPHSRQVSWMTSEGPSRQVTLERPMSRQTTVERQYVPPRRPIDL